MLSKLEVLEGPLLSDVHAKLASHAVGMDTARSAAASAMNAVEEVRRQINSQMILQRHEPRDDAIDVERFEAKVQLAESRMRERIAEVDKAFSWRLHDEIKSIKDSLVNDRKNMRDLDIAMRDKVNDIREKVMAASSVDIEAEKLQELESSIKNRLALDSNQFADLKRETDTRLALFSEKVEVLESRLTVLVNSHAEELDLLQSSHAASIEKLQNRVRDLEEEIKVLTLTKEDARADAVKISSCLDTQTDILGRLSKFERRLEHLSKSAVTNRSLIDDSRRRSVLRAP